LKTIRDRLLRSGEQRTGRLLGLYQQIVQQGAIAADDSPEQVELRLTGLVVKREGKLQVYNCIYEQVFNCDWLEQALTALRPYGGAIAAWLESGCQDESRLLRGQALQDARTWAEGKSLGDDDRRFLDASQELEKRDIQKRLAVEEEAKQVLEEAHQKAKELINRGKFVLAMMVSVAVALGGFSFWSSRQISVAKNELETAKSELGTAREQTEQTRSENTILSTRNQVLSQQINNAKSQEEKTRENLLIAEERVVEASGRVENLERQADVAIANLEDARRSLGSARGNLLVAQREREVARRDREETEQLARVEQKGIALLQQPIERFSQVEVLISALKAAQDLMKISQNSYRQGNNFLLNQNAGSSATLALRVSLNNIVEQNRVRIPVSNYPRAEYSFDDQFIRISSLLFDWSGNHIDSETQKSFVSQETNNESCEQNNEAFIEAPEVPYRICWNDSIRLRREQYYKDDYYIRLYDIGSGQLLAQLRGLEGEFSPNGNVFISSNYPFTGSFPNYHFYNLTDVRRAANIQGSYVQWSSNGKYLMTFPDVLRRSAPVRLYNDSGNFLLQIEGRSAKFSPDSHYIVTSLEDSDAGLVNLYSLNNLSGNFLTLRGKNPEFSPDGQYLAMEDYSKTPQNNIRLYNVSNLEFRSFDGIIPRFSSNGNYLMTSLENQNGSIYARRVYDLESNDYTDIPDDAGYLPLFTPNDLLIVDAPGGKLNLYSLRSLEELPIAVTLEEDVFPTQISNDGKLLLGDTSGDRSRNKNVFIFDMSGRKIIESYGNLAEFSPDSRYVVVSAFNESSGDKEDGVSRLYDRSGRLIGEFRGSYATFNRDGNRLLVSSASETSIYDTSGHLLSVYAGIHPALSPDEQYIVTFSPNGTGRMWHLDQGLDDLISRGCSWLNGYLNNNPDILEELQVCQTEEKQTISAKSLAIQFEIWGKETNTTEADKARLIQQFLVIQRWNPTLPADMWNNFCWFGSLSGYPNQVLEACEKAVSSEPNVGEWRDSRGLARALTGNVSGAIEDFQAFIQWVDQTGFENANGRKAQRQRWVDDLQAGQPPSVIFSGEVLEQLRNQ
jgi:WD40 repeat protein